jgi:SAM-dependent methyltransferase
VDERIEQVFFEIHHGLPREGPGDTASTRRAFAMLTDLPAHPRILDVGCGPGMQTLDLLEVCEGTVTAVDNHQSYLDEVSRRAASAGLADRLRVVNGDMSKLELAAGSFDVIWSEGAIYIMGFEDGLRAWRPLLDRPGQVAVTQVAWLRSDPPGDLQRFWAEEYPAIQDTQANLDAIESAGYRLVGHFPLPVSSWWDHYYTPLEGKLPALRHRYRDQPDLLEVIEMHQREIDLFRTYSDYYGYEFYVMRAA